MSKLKLRRIGVVVGYTVTISVLLWSPLLLVRTVQADGGIDTFARKADFVAVITAATIVTGEHPERIYDYGEQEIVQAAVLKDVGLRPLELLLYPFPPHQALAVAFLHGLSLSFPACMAAWTLLCIFMFISGIFLLLKAWPIPGRPGQLWWLAASSFPPFLISLMLGQSSAILLFGWAAGTAGLRCRRDFLAGAAFGIAALKPQTAPLIVLVLLLTYRWKSIAGFATSIAIAGLIPMPWIGWSWPLRWFELLRFHSTMPVGPANPPATQTLYGLFQRIIGDASMTMVLTGLATGASIVVLVYTWRYDILSRGRAWNPDTTVWSDRWSVTLLLAMLTSSHLLPHDLTLALLPGAIIAHSSFVQPNSRWVAWLWVGWITSFVVTTSGTLFWSPGVLWLLVTALFLLWQVRTQERCYQADVVNTEKKAGLSVS
jgi:hypothetical protein